MQAGLRFDSAAEPIHAQSDPPASLPPPTPADPPIRIPRIHEAGPRIWRECRPRPEVRRGAAGRYARGSAGLGVRTKRRDTVPDKCCRRATRVRRYPPNRGPLRARLAMRPPRAIYNPELALPSERVGHSLLADSTSRIFAGVHMNSGNDMKHSHLALLMALTCLNVSSASATETFDEFSRRVELLTRPVCTCLMDAAIEHGLAPGEALPAAEQWARDALARCGKQLGTPPGRTDGGPIPETTGPAPADRALAKTVQWSDEAKAEFTAGCVQGIVRPAYHDYQTRNQVVDGLMSAHTAQSAVAESYSKNGLLPVDLRAAGLAEAANNSWSSFVASIEIAGGALVVMYGRDADSNIVGKTVTLTPYATAKNDIVWSCGNSSSPPGASPLSAADARPRAATTVANKYLPPSCRPKNVPTSIP